MPCMPETSVSLVCDPDVLIVDGSVDGCFLAIRLAKAGRKVALAVNGTSLPVDIAMTLHPWTTEKALVQLPDDVAEWARSCADTRYALPDIHFLHPLRLTIEMEDRLLDAGVGIWYDLEAAHVIQENDRVHAVIFGCKGGLVAIRAPVVVDCTPSARVAALAGAELAERLAPDQPRLATYCLYGEGFGQIDVDDVTSHGPYLTITAPVTSESPDLDVRLAAIERIGQLKQQHPDLRIARGGDRLLLEPRWRVRGRCPGNLLICGPSADVDNAISRALATPLTGASLLAETEQAVHSLSLPPRGPVPEPLAKAPVPDGIVACCHELPPITTAGPPLRVRIDNLPVIATCDVLVVGAGTSGMPAALSAAEAGADTIVTDKYGDVGGTHTIGGVSKFWFGRQTDFVLALNRYANALVRDTGIPKALGLLKRLVEAGARPLLHHTAVGTLVEGQAAVGALVVTDRGLAGIRGTRVIDATGDADLVARAGTATDFGTQRDAMTLWYSFGQYVGTNPEAARHFAFCVDIRDPADMTQAIVASRRFQVSTEVDMPQVYLTPRETRHIRGACRIDVLDILAGTRWEDLFFVCKANFDIKGIDDSDLSFLGFVEWERLTNHTVQIPYRALLPTELGNVLVVGKAYSVSHDALSLARMQPDMMAMGGAAGLAAAQSALSGIPLDQPDMSALQRALAERGLLTRDDLDSIADTRDRSLPPLSDGELQTRIGRWLAGDASLAEQGALLARPAAALPLLIEAHDHANGLPKLDLARALAWLHDAHGAETLLAGIDEALSADELPGMPRLQKLPHDLPDHGFAPDAVYYMHALGRLGDTRVIHRLARLAKRWQPDDGIVERMYAYAIGICRTAEQLAHPDCREALHILAGKAGIANRSIPRGSDPRQVGNGHQSLCDNRYAYLELCVGRALVRSGSKDGYNILLRYLDDIRGFLARSAHQELLNLTAADHGYHADAWRTAIGEART